MEIHIAVSVGYKAFYLIEPVAYGIFMNNLIDYDRDS